MWVKYLNYAVLLQFQICRNLLVFFPPNLYSQISEFFKKKCFFPRMQKGGPTWISFGTLAIQTFPFFLNKKNAEKEKKTLVYHTSIKKIQPCFLWSQHNALKHPYPSHCFFKSLMCLIKKKKLFFIWHFSHKKNSWQIH